MRQVKIIENKDLERFNEECNKFMADVEVLNFRLLFHGDNYVAVIVYTTKETVGCSKRINYGFNGLGGRYNDR